MVNNELNQFARTVLQLAHELEAEEMRIKQELVTALQQNDIARATKLLEKWIDGPVAEVLADSESEAQPKPGGIGVKRSRRRAKTKKSSTDANA